MKSLSPRLLVWIVAAMMLGSCQTDLVDVPDQSVPQEAVAPVYHDAPAGTSLSQGSGERARGLRLNLLIGRVTRLLTPLLGGTLQIGNSSLVIPPLAVVTPVLATWELRAEAPQGLVDPLNRVYEFWPDGIQFLRPGTLSVTFADAGLGNRDPNQYVFYYYNEQEETWEAQPTTADLENQRFIVTINHFSRYAFGR